MFKNIIRKLWEEEVGYYRKGKSNEEEESIEICLNSDYKYKIFYKAGELYNFTENVDYYSAVRNIFII